MKEIYDRCSKKKIKNKVVLSREERIALKTKMLNMKNGLMIDSIDSYENS